MQRPLKSTNKTSPSISPSKPKVFVGLSGGVDSAVSAVLLKERGYDVTGVFIRAWQPEWMGRCTWRDERRDAMRVALTLGIPFLFIDAEKEYKAAVVDEMLKEYRAGRTPNPDVLCNREIKFGIFWEKAKALGADFIATGHYARLTEVSPRHLSTGVDVEKDQSYFLWTLTQEDLAHTLFPVGGLEKREVRRLAKKYRLPVAEKKDSQGICFMGPVSMDEFLSHYVETEPGEVRSVQGEVIGTHKGLVYYTIGERHGFEVRKKGAASGPFYVVAKDAEKNALIVSERVEEIKSLSPRQVRVERLNLLREPKAGEKLMARIRYRGELLPATLRGDEVEFETPARGVSLGQSIVFYINEELIGGGIMTL